MSDALVLGLGGTVDYEIVWDSSVVERLVEQYDIRARELTTARPIENERDLVVAVLAFLRDGVGGERFVASSDIVEGFAARFDKCITLGGTPVRAALAMRALGITCTLHLVSIDDHVRRLLPAGCSYVCSAKTDSTDPHLIVQFAQGTRVRAGDVDICAPHPNRVILTNDPPNRELVLSDELGPALEAADLFLISGFNCIQDPAVLEDRLAGVVAALGHLPPGGLVLYEDAGYHVPAMSRRVSEVLAEHLDVYSMNEDELESYVGHEVDLLDPQAVADALGRLRELVPAHVLVVHSKYWSLAVGEEPEVYRAALQGGITMASTRYEHGDNLTAQDYAEICHRPVHAGGAALAAQLEERMGPVVCCVPAFVLKTDRPSTIGLGDAFVGGFIAALSLTHQRAPAHGERH